MNKTSNKKGYTLTELMIAVTVMGILTAVAIPAFGSLVKAQNAVTCHVSKQTFYQNYINYIEDDEIDKSKYPNEKFDGNPFLEGKVKYDGSTDKLEDVFKQSFIDYIGGEENKPQCSVHKNHFVITAGTDITIECRDKNGELTEEHNNTTTF